MYVVVTVLCNYVVGMGIRGGGVGGKKGASSYLAPYTVYGSTVVIHGTVSM